MDSSLTRSYPVLGRRVAVCTGNPIIAELASHTFSKWLKLPADLVESGDGFELTVHSVDDETPVNLQCLFAYDVTHGVLTAQGPGVDFSVNRNTGKGTARVSRAYLRNSKHFQRNVLECMGLFLVTADDRIPVHAAALLMGETAVWITGPSGSGKSLLTYGLKGEGFRVLADDALYVSERDGFRIWGNPSGISLCPDARLLFPELADLTPELQPNGKRKIYLDLGAAGSSSSTCLTFTGRHVVVFTERTCDGESRLELLSAAEMRQRFCSGREPGFDISSDYDAMIRTLPVNRAYLLRNNGSIRESVALIQEIVED